SQGWHNNEHDLMPWLEYFLSMLLAAYKELEERVDSERGVPATKQNAVIEAMSNLPAKFKFSDLQQRCPDVSAITIRRTLRKLSAAKRIKCIIRGRDATWQKTKTFLAPMD